MEPIAKDDRGKCAPRRGSARLLTERRTDDFRFSRHWPRARGMRLRGIAKKKVSYGIAPQLTPGGPKEAKALAVAYSG